MAKGVQANWIHRGAPRPANPVRRHPAKSVWTVVRVIMTLLFYVLSPFAQGAADWRSGPRWSIISVLCPVHPFPLRGNSPQGETRSMERKNRESYTSCTIPQFPPLWWLAPPPFPRKRGHYKAPLYCVRLMNGMLRGVLFCPLNRGKSGAARIGGGERSEPIRRMRIKPYDTER